MYHQTAFTNLKRFGAVMGVGAGLIGPAAIADEVGAWRLFVADHAEPQLSVIDLEGGEVLAEFALESPAVLHAGTSGAAVFAVQGAGNVVSAIRSGIRFEDHGDHADIDITEPELVDAAVEGERPVHFVHNRGRIAIFFDDSGLTTIVDERAWIEDGEIVATEIDSGAAHHGVAVPWGELTLISVPHPDDPSNLPIGMDVFDAAGTSLAAEHGCADLHGEASSGNIVAIACAEGILVVSGQSEPQFERIAYAGLPEGKTTTLIGGVGMQYFLGNYGADRVVLFDPLEADAPFRLVELPTRRVHFAVDPIRARFAYVFTEDGFLHQLDVISGAIARSVRVTDPYSMDGHWNDPRPRIAVAGDVVAVTDPLDGVIRLIDAEDFSEAGEIAVEGTPFNIVAVGGSGTAH